MTGRMIYAVALAAAILPFVLASSVLDRDFASLALVIFVVATVCYTLLLAQRGITDTSLLLVPWLLALTAVLVVLFRQGARIIARRRSIANLDFAATLADHDLRRAVRRALTLRGWSCKPTYGDLDFKCVLDGSPNIFIKCFNRDTIISENDLRRLGRYATTVDGVVIGVINGVPPAAMIDVALGRNILIIGHAELASLRDILVLHKDRRADIRRGRWPVREVPAQG